MTQWPCDRRDIAHTALLRFYKVMEIIVMEWAFRKRIASLQPFMRQTIKRDNTVRLFSLLSIPRNFSVPFIFISLTSLKNG